MEITLPTTFIVEARKGDVRVPVDVAALTPDIVAKLALHGLKQKIADAAAGAVMSAAVGFEGNKCEGESKEAYLARLAECAKALSTETINAEATRLMEKVRDTLVAGEWGIERAAAGGIDRRLVDFVIAKLGKAFEAQMEGFAAAKVTERRGMVDAWLDEKEGRRDKYAVECDEAEAEAKRAARVALDDL